MPTFQVYNARVKIAAAAGAQSPAAVVLPVDSLVVRAVPYTAEGATTIDLFRGERKFVAPTWGYTAELTWKNLGRELPALRAAVDLLVANAVGNTPIHLFVEDTSDGFGAAFDPDKYMPNVLPQLDQDTLGLVFEERFRRKRATLRLISRFQDYAQPGAWLTS